MKTSISEILRRNLKSKTFNKIKKCIIGKVNIELVKSLKIEAGDTQTKERISIDFIKKCLESLDYKFKEAGSQKSKDFQNIKNIGLNIEVKKTDSDTVYFNDTLPNLDIFYIIIFTGKEYKKKEDIPPKLIFINGYDLCKSDIYYLLEYKEDMEFMKDKWARKNKNKMATKLKYFSVYPRPTYKINISHLLNSDYSHTLH